MKIRQQDWLGHSTPEQTYTQHIVGVYQRALHGLGVVKPYLSADLYRRLEDVVLLASLYHDLGKLGPDAQDVLHGRIDAKMPNHTDAGVALLLLKRCLNAAWLVKSHHLGFDNHPDSLAEWRDNQKVRARCPHIKTPDTMREYTDKGLPECVKLHDALVPIKPIFSKDREEESWFYRLALSILVDGDHFDTAHHYQNFVIHSRRRISLRPKERLRLLDRYVMQLQEAGGDNPRNRIKQAVYEACRYSPVTALFTYCSAEVGTGKTTAMLAYALAQNPRKIIYIGPYTAILAQTVRVFRASVVTTREKKERKRHKVVAEHHCHNTYRDEVESTDGREAAKHIEEMSRTNAQTWVPPIICTTSVQMCETLASCRTRRLRKYFEFAGAHIIVDEAQNTMPPGLWPFFLRQLDFLVRYLGCRVTFGSGSMIKFWDYPAIRQTAEFTHEVVPLLPPELAQKTLDQELNRVQIEYANPDTAGYDLTAVADMIEQYHGPRIVVMATIHNAVMVARELHDRGTTVLHLSTCLAPEDREPILKQIVKYLEDPDKDWVLVATSCVEAGVDFSFHYGFRELAGLVSIQQLAGRVRRNAEPEWSDAKVMVFRTEEAAGFTRNPALTNPAYITELLFRSNQIGPQFCETAIQKELSMRGSQPSTLPPVMPAGIDASVVIQLDKELCLRDVNDLVRVIPDLKITVIPNEKYDQLMASYEEKGWLSSTEIARKSVQFYSADKPGVVPIDDPGNPLDGLYRWTGGYEPAEAPRFDPDSDVPLYYLGFHAET